MNRVCEALSMSSVFSAVWSATYCYELCTVSLLVSNPPDVCMTLLVGSLKFHSEIG